MSFDKDKIFLGLSTVFRNAVGDHKYLVQDAQQYLLHLASTLAERDALIEAQKAEIERLNKELDKADKHLTRYLNECGNLNGYTTKDAE